MIKEHKILLDLVKKSLHASMRVRIPNDVNWAKIIDHATEQGVLGICFDAFEHIPSECRPDIDNLMEFIGQTEHQVTQYNEHRKCIEKLASICHNADIKMLLLKGYGLSLNYPVPEHRPTGDIDIYLYGDQEKLDNLMESHGVKVEHEGNHHSTFNVHGITIENHQTLLDLNSHKSGNRLEKLFHELMDESVVKSPIPYCYLPSATLNAIYLIRHAGIHFAVEKIKFRHVLDLGCFFEANFSLFSKNHICTDDINWNIVLKVLREEKMMDFYNAIATICVNWLGFQRDVFVGYKENLYLAQKVLDDIFSDEEKLPMTMDGITGLSKVKYGWQKSVRFWRNSWKHKMVFADSQLRCYWEHIYCQLK